MGNRLSGIAQKHMLPDVLVRFEQPWIHALAVIWPRSLSGPLMMSRSDFMRQNTSLSIKSCLKWTGSSGYLWLALHLFNKAPRDLFCYVAQNGLSLGTSGSVCHFMQLCNTGSDCISCDRESSRIWSRISFGVSTHEYPAVCTGTLYSVCARCILLLKSRIGLELWS